MIAAMAVFSDDNDNASLSCCAAELIVLCWTSVLRDVEGATNCSKITMALALQGSSEECLNTLFNCY